MTYTPSWQRDASNTDAEMHRLYARQGLSMMRIAKIFDCRLREVRAALVRHKNWRTLRSSAKGGAHKPKPVSLSRVSILED